MARNPKILILVIVLYCSCRIENGWHPTSRVAALLFAAIKNELLKESAVFLIYASIRFNYQRPVLSTTVAKGPIVFVWLGG
jgi:hypothetical protein